MPSLVVSIVHGKDSELSSIGVVVANAALVSGQEVYLWLSSDGVNWAIQGYASGVHAAGFSPMDELLKAFAQNGGKMIVCPPCFRTRQLDEQKLFPNAELAGGARLAEILGKGAACISY